MLTDVYLTHSSCTVTGRELTSMTHTNPSCRHAAHTLVVSFNKAA